MSTVEVRKAFKVRPCYCPRNPWGDRKCGHVHGIAETYWIVVVDGQPTGERYPRMRDALAAAPKETP